MGRSVSVEPGAPCTDRDRAERCGMSMSPVDAWGRAYLRQCEATEWTRAEALSLGTQETRRSGRGFSSRPLGENSLALNASHGMDYKIFVALQ